MEYNVFQNNKLLSRLKIDKDWHLYNLLDIFEDDTKNAVKIKKEEYLLEGENPIVDQGQSYIGGYTDRNENLYKDIPSIIFGDHTRIIKYVDFPIFIGADGVKLLKPTLNNKELNVKYVYYFLKSVELPSDGYSRHFKYLKQLVVPVPVIRIQNKIVGILDKAQELIDKRKEQIEALDELVKSRFIEMFGDPSVNPMRWPEGTVRDIVTEVKYGTSKPAIEGGKYKYLRMNNITYNGELDISDLKYIDIPDKDVEKCIVRKGDVLFNRTNSKELVGKTCVFNLDEPMVIAGYIIRVRMNERALPEYLSSVLNSKYGKGVLYGMCKAIVGQANINAQELQDIKLFIPSIELQQQYVIFLRQVDKLKFKMEESLKELENNFNSLMSDAFSGRLDI